MASGSLPWVPSAEHNDDDDDMDIVVEAVYRAMQYYCKYLHKEPRMTSTLSGAAWVREILDGHPMPCHTTFGMNQEIFRMLCHDLVVRYGLQVSERMLYEEQVGILLFVLKGGDSNRRTQVRFQHSGETVSRHFNIVLKSVMRMASDIIRPMDPLFQEVPSFIQGDSRYWPYFKDAIGCIDGTHVRVMVNDRDKPRYIGRYGYPTSNFLVACDFDMQFTYVMAGWEGSAHDTRVLDHARRSCSVFPHPPPGKYYLVDSGFPDVTGYLRPYVGTRYHLSEFHQGGGPTNPNETFNMSHSSLRMAIERTFGAWKNRWGILHSLPQFNVHTQVKIAIASMALHNYIVRAEQGIEPCNGELIRRSTSGNHYRPQMPLPSASMENIRAHIRQQLCDRNDN